MEYTGQKRRGLGRVWRRHTKMRYEQRFGKTLTNRARKEIVHKIKNGPAKTVRFIARQSNKVTRWLVYYDQRWFIAIYHKEYKTLKTVFSPPPEILKSVVP